MANKAVFLDRDGTMAPDVHYCRRPEDFELFPYTTKAVGLLNELGFKVIVVTNQSGIARGYFTEDTLADIHQKMEKELAKEGAFVDAIYYCPHHPDDNCDCRKPKVGLLHQAIDACGVKPEIAFLVGDSFKDMRTARQFGAKSILVLTGRETTSSRPDWEFEPDYVCNNLLEASQYICANYGTGDGK